MCGRSIKTQQCFPVHYDTCLPFRCDTCLPFRCDTCLPFHCDACLPFHCDTCLQFHYDTCLPVHGTCFPVYCNTCLPVHYDTYLSVHYAIVQGFHKCIFGRCPGGTNSKILQDGILVLQKRLKNTTIIVRPVIKSRFKLLAAGWV